MADNTTTTKPEESLETSRPKRSELREFVEMIITTLIMALFGITFVVRSVNVPTGSMNNAIYSGDFLLVNKFIFGYEGGLPLDGFTPHRPIRRGDIVVFKFPQSEDQNYVKRVIGLPGETIEIRGQRVYIDGKELPETRIIAENDLTDGGRLNVLEEYPAEGAQWNVYYRPGSDFEYDDREDEPLAEVPLPSGRYRDYKNEPHYGIGRPFKIPEGCYFAMGDNRDNSLDSRYWGPVPRDHVIGRPLFVYASFDPSPHASLGERLGSFFSKGRWKRLGALVK
ncbi:MAG: signal peptidase I [Chloracidobacterium sp.]|uniref:Signal peptidase I n=1 Tax=Chloracidobacterium validum TaxID=2821543 RepID=A0ABX8B8T2_9BACT|nr:signal peptidase I [Chloracidobacterium validum]QUW03339.1 signal peptidase I [Chloracidobacterium validum]